jgi:hypothetical protein
MEDNEIMTKDEMQRFLYEEKARGTPKAEALDRFLRILGLNYGDDESETEANKKEF